MAELRSELTYDAQEVSRSAKAMTSPSYYVRKFPWATLAVAAGVGYMLIPKKKQSVTPDMQALAELIKNNHGAWHRPAGGRRVAGDGENAGRDGADAGRPRPE